jgi:NifU-like protein
MGWDYSEKTKQLFMDAVHGKPGTHMGEIEEPDGLGEHGSIACGDALRFTFRVRRDPADPLRDVITEARYLTFGCTSAIAASEALCRLIEEGGFTPIQALKVTNADIVRYLDGLPEQKIHCSVMGAEALEAAVFNWAQKRGVDVDKLGFDSHGEGQEEGRIVCNCFTLSEPYIKRKIRELGLKTIPEITGAIKAGGACMSCHHVPGGLQDLLDEAWGRQPTRLVAEPESPAPRDGESATAAPLSPFQFSKKVERTIEEYVRPLLRRDGGDLELVDIKDMLVYCRLTGACAGCSGAGFTMKLTVEQVLKETVDPRIRVISV